MDFFRETKYRKYAQDALSGIVQNAENDHCRKLGLQNASKWYKLVLNGVETFPRIAVKQKGQAWNRPAL